MEDENAGGQPAAALAPDTPGVRWLDVQPLLASVTEGMAVGELLHGEGFSLYDAMTALEIGDVKMDIGLQRDRDVESAPELIAAGGAPLDLPGPQLVALMDALLAWEATWHNHAMLPLTVFTSLYMLDIERLQHNLVLHAYCAGLRSCCSAVVELVMDGQVCEDEDILIHTFGIRMLDLPGRQPKKAALRVLATAEEYLEQQVVSDGRKEQRRGGGGSGKPAKQVHGKASTGQAGQLEGQQLQQAEQQQGYSSEVAAALLSRVRLRRLVLEALDLLQQCSQPGLGQAARLCELAAAELPRVEATAGVAGDTQAPGFVPDVNRKHMGLVPPRPAAAHTIAAAAAHFSTLLTALAAACRALGGVQGGWGQLKETMTEFAAQDAHAIVRSVVHLQLSKPLALLPNAAASGGAAVAAAPPAGKANGSAKVQGMERAGAVPLWCPSQQMVGREFGLSLGSLPGPDVATFIEQGSIALQGWCHVACLNRCRQRRRHRRLLEDWRHMLDHATNADLSEPFQAWLASTGWRWPSHDEHEAVGPLSTWVVREACGTMLAYLQLGFPLELYQPYEYRALYWYSDYLLGTQQQALRLLAATAPPPAHRGPAAGRGRPGRGSPQGRGKGGAGADSQSRHAEEVVALEVERQMCQGLFKLASGLVQLGRLPEPETELGGAHERFDQRYGCFAQLSQPEPLSFAHFRQMMRADGVPPVNLLLAAYDHFAKARRGFGVLQQRPAAAGGAGSGTATQHSAREACVMRVAAQNMLAVKLLITSITRAQGEAKEVEQPQEGAEAAAADPLAAFAVGWDLKAVLESNASTFYPVLSLRSSGGGGGSSSGGSSK